MKRQNTKEKILEKSIDLFYECGFVKGSIRELAKRFGMTNSVIYNHFTNKDEILFTIIKNAGDKTIAKLDDVIKKYDDPEECLKQMISSMLYLFSASVMRKEIAIFIDELYQLPEDLREICNKQHRHIFDLFQGKIFELKRKNPINPINEKVATFGILGAILWVYHWYRESGLLSIEEIADELIKLLFDGLMKADKPIDNKQERKPKK